MEGCDRCGPVCSGFTEQASNEQRGQTQHTVFSKGIARWKVPQLDYIRGKIYEMIRLRDLNSRGGDEKMPDTNMAIDVHDLMGYAGEADTLFRPNTQEWQDNVTT